MICLWPKLTVFLLTALPVLQHAGFASAEALPADPLAASDVYGGQKAPSLERFPYIVSIASDNGTWQLCGGVLLNANTVITAAHCSWFAPPSEVRVRAGSLAWNTGGVETSVSEYLVHPDFDIEVGHNDIALWKLSEPIHKSANISYVTLPRQGLDGPPVGTQVIITGWGPLTWTPGDPPTYLHQATVPVAPEAACVARYKEWNMTIDATSQVCVGTGKGDKSACINDGGSPLIGAKFGVFWGILSMLTRNCGDPGHYDLYVRVGKFVDWINKNKF